MGRYAILGDVHGCSRTLSALLRKLPRRDRILSVGDLVDRGPDSPGVLRIVREYEIQTVMGNHEWLMVTGCEPKSPHHESWIMNGGSDTIAQFGGIEGVREVVDEIRSFPLFIDLEGPSGGNILICHAGVKKGLTLKESIDCLHSSDGNEVMNSILWARGKMHLEGSTLVCGHTPIARPLVTPGYVNLDTGCVFRNRLSALLVPEMTIVDVPCED